MKKILALIILLGCFVTNAQNTFPATGNVGIGTTSPASILEIRSTNNKRVWFNYNDESAVTFTPNNGNSVFHISHGHDNNLYFSQGSTVGAGKLMTIKNTGNVGIGTTSPTQKLEVHGTVQFRNSVTANNFLHFDYASNGNKLRSYGTNLFLETRNDTEDIEFRTNNSVTNLMTVKGNGNVGIGTTNPSAKLEIKGGNDVGISLFNDQANYWDIINSTYGKLDFVRAKTNVFMRIDQFGNVGIGTTTPDAKLAVNGNIHTKEVKVDLIGWSDFVFEKDYSLPSLEEVEKHIAEKGHLKDIPSAKEVAENGIFLGEMDSKLLQKIEELMLYTIQQEKKIDELQKLKAENQDLKDRLAKIERILDKG